MTTTTPAAVPAPPPARVTRAPSDVLRAVVAGAALLVTVLVGWLFGEAVAAFAAQLLRGLDALPSWLVTVLLLTEEGLSVVLVIGGLAVALVRRDWALLVNAVAGAAAAAVLVAVLRPLADTDAVPLTQINDALPTLDRLPSTVALAAAVGLATAASPWLSRRWRRTWWLLAGVMALVHFLGTPVSFDTVFALLAGWFSGAAVVVVLGAPSRRPTKAAVADGLARVGVALAELDAADVDARGSTPYFGADTDGTRLFVKVLGADERSADLLFRLYRRLLPRDLGDERSFSSLRRAVEHEALVALVAGQYGVRTPRLVAFAAAEPNGFVLAYEAIAGRSLDRLSADEMTDAVVAAVWAQVARLRHHGIAHRDLRLANAFLAADGEVWIIDFGFSEVAASNLLLANDLAELLASSSTQIGPDRAVTLGLDAVGGPALATALDRLHPPMLSGATRTALAASPGALDRLRALVAERAG
jgi:hypothetical protein